jgi:hypothetical protein
MIALFGWGRHTDGSMRDYKPLTFGEIDAESQRSPIMSGILMPGGLML